MTTKQILQSRMLFSLSTITHAMHMPKWNARLEQLHTSIKVHGDFTKPEANATNNPSMRLYIGLG